MGSPLIHQLTRLQLLMEDIWLNHLLCMKPPWKHQTRYIKIPYHLLQDSSLLTSLPTFTFPRCRGGPPCGPFGPIQPLRRGAPRGRHCWKRRHRRRGQRRRGHRGRQRRLGADGKNNESVARGSATWSDLGGQKKSLESYIFLSIWEGSTKSREFHEHSV